MAYRNGTYFAFDGLGKSNPAESDYTYYSVARAWAAQKNIDFVFVNSHEKANAVRDTSKLATLKTSIRKRMANSKNMVVVLTYRTRKTGSLLSFEIEEAVDRYELPLVLTYPGLY